MLSPAAVISQERAQQQAVALAKEVDCPTSSVQEMVSCFRQKPADVLNDAQTKVGTGEQAGEGHSLTSCPWKTRPRKEAAPPPTPRPHSRLITSQRFNAHSLPRELCTDPGCNGSSVGPDGRHISEPVGFYQ